MNFSVAILPIGDVEYAVLQRLLQDLEPLGAHATLLPAADLPSGAYNRRRGQWRAEALLALARHAPGTQRVLDITDVDLYVEGLNFVFGLAESPGRAAVISTARLHAAGNEALYRSRVFKEAIHELGHTLGLGHCDDPHCVMHFSNSLADTDRKGSRLCRHCRARLSALSPRPKHAGS